MYEKQKSGSILPGETDNSEPFVTSRDVPAQTGAEDPQISPATTGSTSNTTFSTNFKCYRISNTTSNTTKN